MWYFDPGGEGLSADNVRLYANDSLASHHETALGSHRARMELDEGIYNLNPNAYTFRIWVGVLRDH